MIDLMIRCQARVIFKLELIPIYVINMNSLHERAAVFEACNLRLFCNNIDGFLSKRHKFLNSDYHEKFDVIVLQETNISKNHVKYDDFSVLNLATLQFFRTDASKFFRGSMIAWNPEKVDVILLSKECESDYEIGIAKISTGFDYFYFISAYRSPSLSRPETLQFFQTLNDKLDELEGKVLIFGDLNLAKGRVVHYKSDEYDLIRKFILSKSFSDLVSGDTHFNKIGKNFNQLDYVFSNFTGTSAEIVKGFPGIGQLGVDYDHAGLAIHVKIDFPVVTVPVRTVRKSAQVSSADIRTITTQFENAIIEADLMIDRALLEMELAQIELEELIYERRFIESHQRVRGCFRQVSNEIFSASGGDFGQIESNIQTKLQIDMARRIKAKMITKSFGARVMGVFNLGAKQATTLKCNLNPEDFRREIRDAENSVDHSKHPERATTLNHLLKPFSDEIEISNAILKLNNKWIAKDFFTPEFWKHIARKILTPYDQGVRPYAAVETVVKNKEKLNETSGWRLVWKATSAFEKGYDLLRSLTVQTHLLNNDAYCPNRSTQKALAKVCDWTVEPGAGLLGCDFKNAFALVCRKCTNQLLGCDFIPPRSIFTCGLNLANPATTSRIQGQVLAVLLKDQVSIAHLITK